MKYIFFALLISASLALGITAQTQSVRPRIAPTSTPTIKNDTQTTNTNRQPPVLGNGGVRPSGTPVTQSTTGKKSDDDEVVKVETNLVTMPVSVLDREGRFVSGLKQRDFRIFENGVEQKVEYFQSIEQPFTVILMIDVSPSTEWQIEDIQDAAITFIDQLRPTDKVMVISFDERVHVLSRVTNNRDQLRNAVLRAR